MRIFLLALLALVTTYETEALARPLPFKGGASLMGVASDDWVESHVIYAPWRRLGIGAMYIWLKEQPDSVEQQFVLPHLTLLLQRWNDDDFQANLYLTGGLGLVNNFNTTKYAYVLSADADIESRRLYFSVLGRTIRSPDVVDFDLLQGRIGIAPYLANFAELNTWLVLQTDYTPNRNNELTLTPLLRFFYHSVLWEMGMSLRGSPVFNFIVEF